MIIESLKIVCQSNEASGINWIDIILRDWLPILLPLFFGALTITFWKNIALFFRKLKIKFFPTKFNVALAVEFDKLMNSGKYYNEIRKNLLSILDDLNLSGIIRIEDFSDIYLFSNKKEAEKYREKKNLDLIIWGRFTSDELKINSRNINKINLKFTYVVPKFKQDKNNNIGRAIISDIISKIALKNYWQIIEEQSFADVEIVSNNLTDISLYIIGLTLKFRGRLFDSMTIFEKLQQRLIIKNDNLLNGVNFHLIDVYTIFAIDGINLEDFVKTKKFCDKILAIDSVNKFALCNLALSEYRINGFEKSREVVDKALKLYPRDSVVEINVAFIRILQADYNNALKHYYNLLNFGINGVQLLLVIEFLCDEYEKTHEPAMLFASGFLSHYWGDNELAKIDLKKFLDEADEEKYKKMYRFAKKLV